MIELANPLDETLHPHAEAGVLYTAVAAGVQIPIIRLRVFPLFLEAFLDRLQVRLPLATPDDFPDAVAADHVEGEHQVRILGVPRFIERLCDARVMRDDDRLRGALRERAFLERPEVFAPLDVHALRLEPLEGLVVRQLLERRLHGLQEFRRPAEGDDILRPFLRDALARMRDHALRVFDDLVHPRPRLLHLRMPVLREMAGRPGFLRAERRSDVVDPLHREDERLGVELPRLREVGLAAEVLQLEQGRAAFAPRGGNHRRVDFPEPLTAEVLVDRSERRVTDAEDRRHALRPDPEVADVEEELLARVLLDRELLREVHDVETGHPELVAARSALVLGHGPLDLDRGLDQRLLGRGDRLGRDGILRDGRLDDPGRVPDDHEGFASDGPRAVDPAAQLDRLADVASLHDVSDQDHEPPSNSPRSRLPFRGARPAHNSGGRREGSWNAEAYQSGVS